MRPDLLLLQLWLAVTERPRRGGRDRGDVPGWVMVTMLSAVLVVAIIAVAKPALSNLFSNATDSVKSANTP